MLVEADERPDVDTGEPDDPQLLARPEDMLLGAEELRLPVDRCERAVAVDARHRVGEPAGADSLRKTDDDGRRGGPGGVRDGAELFAVRPSRGVIEQREVVAAQEELGEHGDVSLRVCRNRRDRPLGVRCDVAGQRSQLGQERAHYASSSHCSAPNGTTALSRIRRGYRARASQFSQARVCMRT
jgi:hypothetical protein